MARRTIEIDGRQVDELLVDISGAPGRVQRNASGATRVGARAIDRQMTVDAAGHKGNYFGRPGTSYTTPLEKHVSHELLTPLEAEIGIEMKGAGKLAHIIAKGSVKNPPAYDYTAGPRRALPEVEQAYADAAEDSVLGRERG